MFPAGDRMAEERRARERFRIECPVSIVSSDFETDMSDTKGKLVDIGSNGARFLTQEPLEVGSHVVMELDLPSPRRGFNRIRFEGTVMRSQLRHEVAVVFAESGKFLRSEAEESEPAGGGTAQDEE